MAVILGLGLGLIGGGCGPNEVKSTAQHVVEQAQELTQSEITQRLTADLQARIDRLQRERTRLITADGKINWEEAKQTELAEHSFVTLLDWEYKAVLKADGTVDVIQVDHRKGDTKRIASYQVRVMNGQVTLGN
ncbi:MAG: hypothetical protein PHC60_04825 [Heliobacteriaceae bacterium]|nr:hypothetical protein [Heliobacteriaceae bacterium]MDD4587700.1 hypothetical protein [Heliobacteriaceae bacterium]